MTYPPTSGEIAAEVQRGPALLALVPERLEAVAGGWTGATWGWTLAARSAGALLAFLSFKAK